MDYPQSFARLFDGDASEATTRFLKCTVISVPNGSLEDIAASTPAFADLLKRASALVVHCAKRYIRVLKLVPTGTHWHCHTVYTSIEVVVVHWQQPSTYTHDG